VLNVSRSGYYDWLGRPPSAREEANWLLLKQIAEVHDESREPLAGMEVGYDGPEGALISADGRNVMLQQVGEYNPPRWPDPAHPQQAHLDFAVDDLNTGMARALDLASRLNARGERFRVFTDPAATRSA
jgi:hypothetical protein